MTEHQHDWHIEHVSRRWVEGVRRGVFGPVQDDRIVSDVVQKCTTCGYRDQQTWEGAWRVTRKEST